jgi:hypothetical protein
MTVHAYHTERDLFRGWIVIRHDFSDWDAPDEDALAFEIDDRGELLNREVT